MNQTKLVLGVATLMYVLSWLVPTLDGGATLADGALPGWEAFRLALAPIWPYGVITGDGWFSDLISVSSALTNLLFVISLLMLQFLPPASGRWIFWGLVIAALVNALWFILSGDRGDLRLGYYLWVGSFLGLAAAARMKSWRAAPNDSELAVG